jgi:hypothetical protein
MANVKHGYLLKGIPNTDEGHAFIAQFKQFLNTDTYKVTLRGNGPRASVAKENGYNARAYDQGLPLNKSAHFRLYIDRKP